MVHDAGRPSLDTNDVGLEETNPSTRKLYDMLSLAEKDLLPSCD